MSLPLESFAALELLPFIRHGFTTRPATGPQPANPLGATLARFGYRPDQVVTAEQVHGAGVALADRPAHALPGVDALITRTPCLPLVIRCADCAAVYLVDRATPAIGLVHSGRAGTAANAVVATIAAMTRHFGTHPSRCLAVISPSIGPCHYEVDLWTAIERQLREAGVTNLYNSRVCTACNLDRYFSYRAERGHTGRMFAFVSLEPGGR